MKRTCALLSSLDPITEVSAPGYARFETPEPFGSWSVTLEGFDSHVMGVITFLDGEPTAIYAFPVWLHSKHGDKLFVEVK